MRVDCTCLHCGKQFPVTPYELSEGRGKYCGLPCSWAHRSLKVTLNCAVCGAPFQQKLADMRVRTRGKYCGNPCRFVAQTGRYQPIAVRWNRYVSPDPTPGLCWDWQGKCLSRDGYGRLTVRSPDGSKRDRLATHVAWELVAGPVPEGFFLCHTCDRPICVRNDDEGWYEVNGVVRPRRGHLWLGTAADNAADMALKGRVPRGDRHSRRLHPERVPRGEQQPFAKLTDDAVREIRRVYATGRFIQRQLAERYGVNQTQISNVVLGRTWKHVE